MFLVFKVMNRKRRRRRRRRRKKTKVSLTLVPLRATQVCIYEQALETPDLVYDVTTDLDLASCVVTSNNTLTVPDLLECHAYISDVSVFSSAFITSSPLTTYSMTICNDLEFSAYSGQPSSLPIGGCCMRKFFLGSIVYLLLLFCIQ